jgi:outer membrane usher protein
VFLRSLAAAGALLISGFAVAASAASLEQTVYSVAVNGATIDDGAIVLKEAGGAIYVKAADAVRWRLIVPAAARRVEYGGEAYVALSDLNPQGLKIDSSASKISFGLPAAAFRTDVSNASNYAHPTAVLTPGAFLNYELHGIAYSGEKSVSGEFQQGVATPGGVFLNDVSYALGTGGTPILSRLGTSFLIDQPAKLREIRIGDTLSVQDDIGHAVNLAGVSVATDFGVDPSFIYYAGVNVGGATAVPSAMDLFVNNVLQLQKNVDPGPYQINNVPVIDGSGNVTLLTTDAAGVRHYETIPYYFTRAVLKPGVDAYDYSIGYLRNAYTGPNQYGPLVVILADRHGFTPSFTGGLHVESDGGSGVFGATADWVMKRFGAFSASVAESAGGGLHGDLLHLGWSYDALRFRLGAIFETRDPNFRSADSLGSLGNSFAGETFQFNASTNIGKRSFASVLYSSTVGRTGDINGVNSSLPLGQLDSAPPFGLASFDAPESVKYYAATFGTTLRDGVHSTITAYRTVGQGGFAFQGSLIVPLAHGRTLTQSFGHDGSGSNSTEIDQGLPDSGMGLGYAASIGEGAGHTSSIDAYDYSPVGSVNVDAQVGGGQSLFEADASGSLVLADRALLPAQRIGSAFAVVEVPGEAGVPVFVNQRYVGTTNQEGKLAVANLTGFSANQVSVDISKLPLDVDVPDSSEVLTPYDYGASVARFKVVKSAAVTFDLHGANGDPLPAGSSVRVIGSEIVAPVGLDGLVYLSPVSPGRLELEADMGVDGKCRAQVSIPIDTSAQPNLGKIVCK